MDTKSIWETGSLRLSPFPIRIMPRSHCHSGSHEPDPVHWGRIPFNNKIVLNITLPEFAENMEHLEKVRSSFDTLYGGPGKRMGPFSTGIMKRPSMASCRILPVNHQRLPAMAPKRQPWMRRAELSTTAAPYGRGQCSR